MFIFSLFQFSPLTILSRRFQYGKPFLPFHQLMAVLPPASMRLIPPALRPLMLESASPILDFYPLEFDQVEAPLRDETRRCGRGSVEEAAG